MKKKKKKIKKEKKISAPTQEVNVTTVVNSSPGPVNEADASLDRLSKPRVSIKDI